MENVARNVVLGAVAVAALGVATYMFVGRSPGKLKVPQKYNSHVVCLACKTENQMELGVRDLPPFDCPSCGQKAAVQWYFCNGCHHRVVPHLVREAGKLPYPSPFPTCPLCNCTEVGAWMPELGSQNSVGDAKLPQWP